MKPYKLNAILNQPPAFGSVRRFLPDAAIERIYQKQLLGGFDRKRRCPNCNILLPTSSKCDYCS